MRRSRAIWYNPDLFRILLLRTADDETVFGSETSYQFLVLTRERE